MEWALFYYSTLFCYVTKGTVFCRRVFYTQFYRQMMGDLTEHNWEALVRTFLQEDHRCWWEACGIVVQCSVSARILAGLVWSTCEMSGGDRLSRVIKTEWSRPSTQAVCRITDGPAPAVFLPTVATSELQALPAFPPRKCHQTLPTHHCCNTTKVRAWFYSHYIINGLRGWLPVYIHCLESWQKLHPKRWRIRKGCTFFYIVHYSF